MYDSGPLWDHLPAKPDQNCYIRIRHDLDHANMLEYNENHACMINIKQDMASRPLRDTQCPSEIDIRKSVLFIQQRVQIP